MDKYSRNLTCYILGLSVSIIGSILFSFSTGLYLLETTKSGMTFALNLSFFVLPVVLLSPYFGFLVDKYSKKKLILISDFLNGTLMVALYFLWGNGYNTFLIYLGSILTGVFSNLVAIAFETGKPDLFENKYLVKINSYSVIINNFSTILGPVFAGIIYSFFDLKIFILLNGFSFFLSFLFEAFLIFKSKGKSEEEKHETSIKILFSDKVLLKKIILLLLFNISATLIFQVSIPYILNINFNIKKELYGIIQSFLPIGMICGAFITNFFKFKFNNNFIEKSFSMLGVLGLVSFLPIFIKNNSSIIFIYGFVLFFLGIIGSSIDILIFSYFQETLNDSIRGKIIGTFISLMKIVVFLTIILSGKIVDSYSPYINFFLSLTISVIALLYLKISKIFCNYKKKSIENG